MVSYEHKIVTDSDPGKMEKKLDELTADGWELHSTSSAIGVMGVLFFVAVLRRTKRAT